MVEDRAAAPLDGVEAVLQAGFIKPECAARRAAAVIGERMEMIFDEVPDERRLAHVGAGRIEASADIPAPPLTMVCPGELS